VQREKNELEGQYGPDRRNRKQYQQKKDNEDDLSGDDIENAPLPSESDNIISTQQNVDWDNML
jgi:hypothetical protein